jgi:hypothetical protein
MPAVRKRPRDHERRRHERQCHHGPYELPGLTGLEVAPGGRHLYALESAYRNGYGTGAVQLMKRH